MPQNTNCSNDFSFLHLFFNLSTVDGILLNTPPQTLAQYRSPFFLTLQVSTMILESQCQTVHDSLYSRSLLSLAFTIFETCQIAGYQYLAVIFPENTSGASLTERHIS